MDSPVTASAYADRYGIAAAVVVAGIRAGTLRGARSGGVWYTEDQPPPPRPTDAPVARAVPAVLLAPPAARERKVVRYTSQTYVHVLMGLVAALIAADVVSAVFSHDLADLRGVGMRVFVLVALRTQHRWTRTAVQIWAGGLVLGGAAGLATFWFAPSVGTAWWAPALYGGFLAVGVPILATAHRYIKVEVPDDREATLDDIAREPRLD